MSGTVLVVDDDPAIRLVVKQNLTLEGFEVLEAADGIEAMQQITKAQPGLVVLDVMMPGLDGYAVLEQMRGRKETAEIPVILLTALSSTEEVWEGWNRGVDYYMTKPFDVEELVRFVTYIFEGRGAEAGPGAGPEPPSDTP